jgi:hypothetical protein
VNVKITGGFRGIKHWRAVKASELKIPADDSTIKRARMAIERNMVKVQYLGLRLSLLRNNERR